MRLCLAKSRSAGVGVAFLLLAMFSGARANGRGWCVSPPANARTATCKCHYGYYSTDDSTCRKCEVDMPGCRACEHNGCLTYCTQCRHPYTMSGSTCVYHFTKQDGCSEYDYKTDRCKWDNGKAEGCVDDHFFRKGPACQRCEHAIPHCRRCGKDSAGRLQCHECLEGFGLVGTGGGGNRIHCVSLDEPCLVQPGMLYEGAASSPQISPVVT